MIFSVDRTGVLELQGGVQFRKAEYHYCHKKTANMRKV